MLWVTLFVAVVISLAVALYVVRPLLDRGPAPVYIEDDRLTDLLSRKDVVLRAIKDLEFDRNVGKLEEVDFVRFNQSLSRQALGLMQQIEKIAPTSSQHDDALEQEIARLRKTTDRKAGDTLEQEIARLRKTPERQPAARSAPVQVAASGAAKVEPAKKVVTHTNGASPAAVANKPKFCTECGEPVNANHKFCANCGAALA